MDQEKTVCEERHEIAEARFKILQWMVGILITVSIVASGFVISASSTSGEVLSKLSLISAKYDSELARLNREIDIAKEQQNDKLMNAIEVLGYQQREATEKILNKAQRNTEEVSEIAKKLDDLVKTVDQIK